MLSVEVWSGRTGGIGLPFPLVESAVTVALSPVAPEETFKLKKSADGVSSDGKHVFDLYLRLLEIAGSGEERFERFCKVACCLRALVQTAPLKAMLEVRPLLGVISAGSNSRGALALTAPQRSSCLRILIRLWVARGRNGRGSHNNTHGISTREVTKS